MKTFILSLLCFSLLSVTSHATQVYKWTDSNGLVHFSQHPPKDQHQNSEALELRTSSKLSKESADTNSPNQAKNETLANQENAQTVQKEISQRDKQKEENCRIAKENKEKLSSNFNRRFQQEDGSIRPFTDEERETLTKRADESIRNNCR